MNKTTLLHALLVTISLLLATGCPPETPPEDEDTTSPTVSAVQPADGATDVAPNTSLSVTFSEDVDIATVDSSSFSLTWLEDGAAAAVGATVAADGATATLTPSVDLAYATTYTATIGTAVTDVAGNSLATDYTWSFTTGSQPDLTAPSVASRTPPDAATAVETTASISVTFTEPMAASSVTDTTFTVSRANGFAVPGGAALSTDGLTLTFTPTIGLPIMTVCEVTLLPGIEDLAGNALESGDTWSFTTREGAWDSEYGLYASDTENGWSIGPQVAFDGAGTGHVVWSFNNTTVGHYCTYAQRFDASETNPWGASAVQLSGTSGSEVSTTYYTQPAIASNMLGTAVAVWHRTGEMDSDPLYWSRYSAGSWSAAAEIADSSTLNSTWSTIHAAMDLDGNVIALSVGNDESDHHLVYSTRLAAGSGSWGLPDAISLDDLNSYNPYLAFDASGNAYAVWMDDSDPVEHRVYADRFDGSSWSESMIVSSTQMYSSTQPRLAVDAEGTVMAAWVDSPTGNAHANLYDANSAWSGWGSGTDQYLGAGMASYEASVAMEPSGRALVGWPTGGSYCLSLYEPDSGWNATTVYVGTTAYGGRVALDGSGNAIVVWTEYESDLSFVRARRFVAGSSWAGSSWSETETICATGSGNPVEFLELAVDPNGIFIAVFSNGLAVGAVAFR